MSRRFGRNQKRRIREELANADKLTQLLNQRTIGALDEIRNKDREIFELKEEIQDAKDVLGDEFIGFRRKNDTFFDVNVKQLNREIEYYPKMSVESLQYNLRPQDDAFIRTRRLDVIACSVEKDKFANQVLLRLKVNGASKFGMAINQREMINVPHHVLMKRISHEFAHMFINELKNLR